MVPVFLTVSGRSESERVAIDIITVSNGSSLAE
jgi:hypothetical protein